ncbi:MAG: TetR/AcrR family transcriptional regulator [Clostridiales bacterium]|nr:TetR/AcrR family transcriptional regulator [Clostridiales bacterium]
MGKIESNKQHKKQALLDAAYDLFTKKGFANTPISANARQPHLAKGTFYLYFKDKFDLKDALIEHKTRELFNDAYQALLSQDIEDHEKQLLYITDYIITVYEDDHDLMELISRNLSWDIYKNVFTPETNAASPQFYEYFHGLGVKNNIAFGNNILAAFTIIELVNSTCYSCILYGQPVPMKKYLPYLHRCIHQILLINI